MTINLFNLCQHFSYLFIPIFQYVGIGWLNPFNLCQHVKKNRYKKVIRNVGIGWLLYKHDWSCIESVYHHWCCEFQSRSRGGVQRQWIATGQWFSRDPPVSSTNKTDHHIQGVKPQIHQSELRTLVPFKEKKFLSLCSIVKTTEWNGIIKIYNWS
jgi:hypothetical protein